MLFLLNDSVIFTVLSLKTSLSGAGKKSVTTSDRAIASATRFGALLYFVLLLIFLFALSPVSRAENPNLASAMCKTNRQDSLCRLPKTKEPLLVRLGMFHVLRNDSLGIQKGILCIRESNSMPRAIGLIL